MRSTHKLALFWAVTGLASLIDSVTSTTLVFVSCFLPSPLPPSSLTSTQFSVETQVYKTVIKMNTLGLQLVWNRLSAQASSPSLALALHHRIVSLGILSGWPMQRCPCWTTASPLALPASPHRPSVCPDFHLPPPLLPPPRSPE